jgi:hypothetical protein
LVSWSLGLLVSWSLGLLVSWSLGHLVPWSLGPFVAWSVFRFTPQLPFAFVFLCPFVAKTGPCPSPLPSRSTRPFPSGAPGLPHSAPHCPPFALGSSRAALRLPKVPHKSFFSEFFLLFLTFSYYFLLYFSLTPYSPHSATTPTGAPKVSPPNHASLLRTSRIPFPKISVY